MTEHENGLKASTVVFRGLFSLIAFLVLCLLAMIGWIVSDIQDNVKAVVSASTKFVPRNEMEKFIETHSPYVRDKSLINSKFDLLQRGQDELKQGQGTLQQSNMDVIRKLDSLSAELKRKM
jgi:hypothetical protein